MNSLSLKRSCTAVLLMNRHVARALLGAKLLTLGGASGFCTAKHGKQRGILA